MLAAVGTKVNRLVTNAGIGDIEQIQSRRICVNVIGRLRRVPEIDQFAINDLVRWNVKVFLGDFLDAFRNGIARRNKHRP
jgi:hypothetical protein